MTRNTLILLTLLLLTTMFSTSVFADGYNAGLTAENKQYWKTASIAIESFSVDDGGKIDVGIRNNMAPTIILTQIEIGESSATLSESVSSGGVYKDVLYTNTPTQYLEDLPLNIEYINTNNNATYTFQGDLEIEVTSVVDPISIQFAIGSDNPTEDYMKILPITSNLEDLSYDVTIPSFGLVQKMVDINGKNLIADVTVVVYENEAKIIIDSHGSTYLTLLGVELTQLLKNEGLEVESLTSANIESSDLYDLFEEKSSDNDYWKTAAIGIEKLEVSTSGSSSIYLRNNMPSDIRVTKTTVGDKVVTNPYTLTSGSLIQLGIGTFDSIPADNSFEIEFVYTDLETNAQYTFDGANNKFKATKVIDDEETCVDTDGGKNYDISGTVTVASGTHADYCQDSTIVAERYCKGTNLGTTTYICENGCENGVCVSEKADIATCTDTDGTNSYTKGKVLGMHSTGEEYSYEDTCQSDSSVKEFYCEGDYNTNKVVNCEYGCSNGACNIDATGNDEAKNLQEEPDFGYRTNAIEIQGFMGYADPFSAQSWSTIKEIVEDYSEDVYFTFTNMPFEFHDNEFVMAQAGECVKKYGGDDSFAMFTDSVFSENPGFDNQRTYVLNIAKNVLDLDIKSCLDTQKMLPEVLHDIQTGEQKGITGTPTFYVNGEKVIGAQQYGVFENIILEQLGESEQLPDDFVEEGCFDTDNGKEFFKKGTVYIDGAVYKDQCTSESELDERYCNDGSMWTESTICDLGCSNGACKTASGSDNNQISTSTSCQGCSQGDSCLPVGTRILQNNEPVYCSFENKLIAQFEIGESCQNDYECGTNSCQSGTCIDLAGEIQENRNLLERILSWFGGIFG